MSLLGIEPMTFILWYLGNGTFPDLTDVTTGFCAKFWSRVYRNWKWLFLKVYTRLHGQCVQLNNTITAATDVCNYKNMAGYLKEHGIAALALDCSFAILADLFLGPLLHRTFSFQRVSQLI